MYDVREWDVGDSQESSVRGACDEIRVDVAGLVEDDVFAGPDVTIGAIVVEDDDAVSRGHNGRELIPDEATAVGSLVREFPFALVRRDEHVTERPEGVEHADVHVKARQEMVWRVIDLGVVVEVESLCGVLGRDSRDRVKHGNVGLSGNDPNSSFGNAAGMLVVWGC